MSAVALGALVLRRQQSTASSSTKTTNAQLPTPPHVHSWVPFVGSGIAMGQKGLLGFVRSAAQGLAKRQDANVSVFTATVLGDPCLFFADPADVMTVFKAKYQKYLDVLSLQKQFVGHALGASPDEVEESFRPDMIKAGTQQYHHYLFKGPELERSMISVQKFFLEWLPNVADNAWKRQNLYKLVSSAIFRASTGPLLSFAVPKSDEAFENFITFDKNVIPLFNNIPRFLLSKAIKARDGLLSLVASKEYWDQASPLMMERKKTLGLSDGSLDRANLGLLWASSGNSAPAVFWLVLRLLEDPEAWKACLAQVNQIVAKRDNSYMQAGFTLSELDEMTLLESAFQESLRMYQANATARKVVQGFELETASGQSYWIPAGTKLMAIWNVLNMDPHVHQQPEEFRYNRFVDKEQTYTFADGQVLKHDPIIPFGGGSHLCPGRKFISYEARLFCAMLMTSLEFRLVEDYQRPEVDFAMQGIGVAQPVHDPVVECRLRR